ncbi:unnamed protein product [Brugia pahangi]|uniref:Uncharacterized protein n=1 Tax=Brugia pahangi TaxID=6280 RepID=A0A0N4THN2_BRUPA|nr:unnamed protein product [Brugia pahangi]
MPLSCKGRQRGVTPPRGDIDDALGNTPRCGRGDTGSIPVLGSACPFENFVLPCLVRGGASPPLSLVDSSFLI